MLTINLIREKKEFVIERLKVKNFEAGEIVERILSIDSKRREVQSKSDALQADMNSISKEIGALIKAGRKEESEAAKNNTYKLKEEIRSLTDRLAELDFELRNEIVKLPNLPHELVAPGHGADDNVKVKEGGTITPLPDSAVPHWDLIRKYDIIDFDLGIKLTGA